MTHTIDTKSVSGINRALNSSDSDARSKDIVPIKDIGKIVEDGLELYSWGGNPINFRRETSKGELFLEATPKGYGLEIQVVSDTPYPHGFNRKLVMEFFEKRNIGFGDVPRLYTDKMDLTKALKLYSEFESQYDDLSWPEDTVWED